MQKQKNSVLHYPTQHDDEEKPKQWADRDIVPILDNEAFFELITKAGSDRHFMRFLWDQLCGAYTEECEDSKYYKPIANLIGNLDALSRTIMMALIRRRHATIDELARDTGIQSNEVLRRIKEIIVPLSKKNAVHPVVTFEQSKLDQITGERISFSWWIAEGVPQLIVDKEILDEGEEVIVITDIPELPLPDTSLAYCSYRNGVLEIRIRKVKIDE